MKKYKLNVLVACESSATVRKNKAERHKLIIKRIQAWLMLWLGRRLFAFVKTWAPKENQAPAVMHFAHSERDFNIATRQHVEELDDETCAHHYAEVLSGVKCIKCGHFVGNWE